MFRFLADVLDKGGIVAVMFTVMIVVFGAVAWLLWNENKSLRREIRELQDKRFDEAKLTATEVTKVIEANRNALERVFVAIDIFTKGHR